MRVPGTYLLVQDYVRPQHSVPKAASRSLSPAKRRIETQAHSIVHTIAISLPPSTSLFYPHSTSTGCPPTLILIPIYTPLADLGSEIRDTRLLCTRPLLSLSLVELGSPGPWLGLTISDSSTLCNDAPAHVASGSYVRPRLLSMARMDSRTHPLAMEGRHSPLSLRRFKPSSRNTSLIPFP